MTTGEKIRSFRKALGMTQEELGNAIGVGKAAINKYETGVVVNLKRSTLSALAKALHVTLSELLDDDAPVNEPEPPKTDDIRLLIRGLNKLSPEQIEQAKNVFLAMFKATNPDLFDEGDDDK